MTIVPLVKVPARAKKGETVMIRAKLKHPMETGWRKNAAGAVVPRKRIFQFVCTQGNREMLRADLHSGVSADPYFAFFVKAEKSGVYRFQWFEDGGTVYETSAVMEVVG